MNKDKQMLITLGVLLVGLIGLSWYAFSQPPVPPPHCKTAWFEDRRFGEDRQLANDEATARRLAPTATIYQKEVCAYE